MTSDIDFVKVRGIMLEKGVTQQELLDKLVALGVFEGSTRNSAYVSLNFALSGKRSSKKYKELLNKCMDILSKS